MHSPAARPHTAATVDPQSRSGARSVPGMALAVVAVLGAHLWALDAWSLPADAAATATVQSVQSVPYSVTALPAPPMPSAAPLSVPLPLPLPLPTTKRVGMTQPARTQPAPEPSTNPVPAPLADAPDTAPATTPESASAPSDDMAEPRLLALATIGGAAMHTATALNTLVPPPSARLRYRMKKGPLAGFGQIDWQREASTYRMRLEARVPVFGQIFMETSEGRLDTSGLAPLRHTERRIKRSERAVSFVRDQGAPRILFSAREGQAPLTPGAQDRLSWIAQLATYMAAPPSGEWRAGQQLDMDVASTSGDVQRWIFTIMGKDSAGLWLLRREPDSPHDTRAEVWIDARQHHWPVRIRLSEPGGDPLELTLDGLQPT
jgi:Protein of unknown function (DUF3108)